jgi:hypothetical protein
VANIHATTNNPLAAHNGNGPMKTYGKFAAEIIVAMDMMVETTSWRTRAIRPELDVLAGGFRIAMEPQEFRKRDDYMIEAGCWRGYFDETPVRLPLVEPSAQNRCFKIAHEVIAGACCQIRGRSVTELFVPDEVERKRCLRTPAVTG